MKEWNPDIELISGPVHEFYLREAYRHASLKSDDVVTQTGALIVSSSLEEILAVGVNHYPAGLEVTEDNKLDRDWKYKHILHAEPSAIYDAARNGKKLDDSVMYMPWIPCVPCAKAIIDSGIKMLVGHKEMIMKTPERWWDETDYAIGLLKDCGVERYMVDKKLGDVKNLFDGKVWEP